LEKRLWGGKWITTLVNSTYTNFGKDHLKQNENNGRKNFEKWQFFEVRILEYFSPGQTF